LTDQIVRPFRRAPARSGKGLRGRKEVARRGRILRSGHIPLAPGVRAVAPTPLLKEAELSMGFAQKVVEMDIPLLSKEYPNCPASRPITGRNWGAAPQSSPGLW
jgi:hypothetical protein